MSTKPSKSLAIIRFIDLAKTAVVGAICGLGAVNAIFAFMGSVATDGAEKAAMAAGAVIVATAVKVFHIV